MPESSATEFLHTGLARYDEPTDNERDREEGHDGVESPAVELDVAVDAFCVEVQCIEALDDGGDEGEETEDDDDIDGYESVVENGMPAGVGVRGPDYALGKEEVDDKEEQHSGGDEDVGRNRNLDIEWVDGPNDAHDHGDDSRHAEAEHHAGDDEDMTSSSVDLEYGHVGDGADEEEDEKDGAYWDIKTNCG